MMIMGFKGLHDEEPSVFHFSTVFSGDHKKENEIGLVARIRDMKYFTKFWLEIRTGRNHVAGLVVSAIFRSSHRDSFGAH